MARQLRVQYAGAIYHVTVRSNSKEELFGDNIDRRYFLSHMAETAENHKVRVYLACLIPKFALRKRKRNNSVVTVSYQGVSDCNAVGLWHTKK